MTISRRNLIASAIAATVVNPARAAETLYSRSTPIRMGAVCLAVGNLSLMTAYYREAIGLLLIEGDARRSIMGAGGVPLLILEASPGSPPPAGAAGLYHTAFLMPRREDLGAWLLHAARTQIRISGASDHLVSEAIYLDDPEGNGIEVYCDRPAADWAWSGSTVEMASKAPDIDGLLALGERQSSWFSAAPPGMRVGHVHLKVGDVERGIDFYGMLGMVPTRKREGAGFMASGGYHHHIGMNTWQSAGAEQRDPDALGLRWITLEYAHSAALDEVRSVAMEKAAATETRDGRFLVSDPWGTQVSLARL